MAGTPCIFRVLHPLPGKVRDMVSSLRLDVDARRRKVDEILATVRGADGMGMGGMASNGNSGMNTHTHTYIYIYIRVCEYMYTNNIMCKIYMNRWMDRQTDR